jgi:hypothetical protein
LVLENKIPITIRKPYERKKKMRMKKKWPGERSTKHQQESKKGKQNGTTRKVVVDHHKIPAKKLARVDGNVISLSKTSRNK